MQTAYLIKNPMLQEYDTVHWVNEHVISACPYDGPKQKEYEFRRQISVFFWHLVHCSVYNKVFRDKNELAFIPVPYSIGHKELPLVFGTSSGYGAKATYAKRTETVFSRSLDWLMENIVIASPYSYGADGKSRAFKIREEIFDGMYPIRPKSAKDILTKIRYCKPHFTKGDMVGKTIEKICVKRSKKHLTPPVHDLRSFDRNTQRKAVKRYREVLERLSPNTISLRPIVNEIAKYSHYSRKSMRARVVLLHSNLMAFLSNDFTLVELDRLIIKYYPTYRVSKLGGRLFEESGGFQNLPRAIKQRSHCVGHNVDMQSSQLNILKMELQRHKIPCRLLNETNSISDFADKFNLPKEITKVCFYGMMFSIGGTMRRSAVADSQAMKSIRSSLRKECRSKAMRRLAKKGKIRNTDLEVLTTKFVDVESENVRERWERETQSIVVGLEALCESYISSARKSGDGFVLTNAVGARFGWSGEVDSEVRKRVLSHMITGIETDILFTAIEENDVKRVYSFEHDGALLSRCRLKSDRIKFVKKPFDTSAKQFAANL